MSIWKRFYTPGQGMQHAETHQRANWILHVLALLLAACNASSKPSISAILLKRGEPLSLSADLPIGLQIHSITGKTSVQQALPLSLLGQAPHRMEPWGEP